jgi:hypothetical protein
MFSTLGQRYVFIPSVLEHLAAAAAEQAQRERAARLWGAAEALREAIGALLPTSERPEYDRRVAVARSTLGEEAFATAWAEGAAMSLERAVEFALSE